MKGSLMADDDIQYEIKTVTTVRGTEARSRSKWEKERWEFVSQSDLPLLRTQLTFRRPKPKPPWLVLGVAGGVVVVGFVILVVMSLITGGDNDTATPTQTTTAAAPGARPSEEPAETYTYEGPQYEIVSVDEDQSAAELNQYWVYTSELNTSTEAYKDQVKMIIADIAHAEGTDLYFVEVVKDREIALAESPSTYESFIEEHGVDYAVNTIPQKEGAGWVASFAGGFDYDAGEPSESAFEIVWWPAGTPESETWKPETVG